MSGVYFSDHNESLLIPGMPAGTQNSVYQAPTIWDDVSYSQFGVLTVAPITVSGFSFTGERVLTWFDDWYNRIHIVPNTIDLNNVITDQTREILLWNAYLTSKSLTSTDFPAVQGVSVTSPVSTPYTLRPLEDLTYILSVSSDGPPVINVSLTWNITGEEPFTVDITGRRIVVWPFPPNWSTPLVESLDWYTDVITAHYGDEQRIQLRSKPRRMFEYTATMMNASDSAIASNLLWGWQNRNYALPLWVDLTVLSSTASIGTVTLSMDTTNRGFFAGGLLLLLKGPLDYEAVEIDSFTPTTITLAKPLERTWVQGTKVYPVNISQMPTNVPRRMLTDSKTEMMVSFAADPVQTDPYIPAGTAPTTYNGYEVILRKPNWAQPVDVDNQFDYDTIDFNVGGSRVLPNRQFPMIVRRFQWRMKTRTDAVEFRKLLGRLKGRFKPAYLPTWFDDFKLYATEVASSSTIRVQNNEFYKMVGSDPALKTLMILLKNGTVVIRLINSVGTDPAGFTTLGLDASIGYDLNSTSLARLSLVHLCRQASDRVTINYLSSSVTTVEANFALVKE